MSAPIQADPDDLEKHGRAFGGHGADMTSVHDELSAALAGDIGIGTDAFSQGFRERYLAEVHNLAAGIGDSASGLHGISEGMVKMASDYRTTDDAALRGVSKLGTPSDTTPHTGS